MKRIPPLPPPATPIGALFYGYVACVVAFNLISSKVDEEGVLTEPFFLVLASSLLL